MQKHKWHMNRLCATKENENEKEKMWKMKVNDGIVLTLCQK